MPWRVSYPFYTCLNAVIDELVTTGTKMLTSAGGFEIEHPLLAPRILRIEGYRESVVGLPTKLLCRLISEVTASADSIAPQI